MDRVYDWDNYEVDVNTLFPVPDLTSDEIKEEYTHVSDEEAAKVVAKICMSSQQQKREEKWVH